MSDSFRNDLDINLQKPCWTPIMPPIVEIYPEYVTWFAVNEADHYDVYIGGEKKAAVKGRGVTIDPDWKGDVQVVAVKADGTPSFPSDPINTSEKIYKSFPETMLTRKNGLQLVVDKIAAMNPDGYPMVLTGDFNVTPDDECLVELDKQMQSARKIAKVTDNFTTYNAWGGNTPEKEYVIDYIYVSGFSAVPEFRTDINAYAGKQFISDHYPIVAVLCF